MLESIIPETPEQLTEKQSQNTKAMMKFFKDWGQMFISGAMGTVPGDVAKKLKQEGVDLASGASKIEDLVWEFLIELVVSWGVADRKTVEGLLKFKGMPFPANTLFNIVAVGSILGHYMSQVGSILGTPAQRNLMELASPNLPREEFLIKAGFIAPEKIKEVRKLLRQTGFSEESIDLMFISTYQMIDVETIRNLYLRKAIDVDTMFMRMRELGFTDTRTKEIVKSWEIIPGPSDLFHLVAKEAFEPDMVKHMGLDVEFPEEQVKWLEAQGLSRYWAEKYWAAHWDIPSIQQGFEMYHRNVKEGGTVIDDKELDMLYRAAEIPPFWREKFTQIAYIPYTRVDVRRMHDMGVLTEEETYLAYRDLGFDHDKATNMLKFTIQYNQQNDKEITKSQIIAGYKAKIVTREETLELIEGLDYSKDQAIYILSLEDYKELKDYEDDAVANIKDRFQNNLIDEFEARKRLNLLNLPALKTDLLIDRWSLNMFSDRKVPSKTDLDKFLKHKIIDVDIYRVEMDRLGYNFQYISWYEALNKKLS